jgi:ribose/xylose/arabinose/galactoside ABC-type transport system permease subunit
VPAAPIESPTAGRGPSVGDSRLRLTQETGVAASIVVLVVIFSFLQPLFANPGNLLNITRQGAEPALLAMGQAFAMIAGGFDLSIGAITG